MITIFTPTYNRKHTLSKLYQSLKEQTSKEFIWLIVDDGSSDGTRELVTKWSLENEVKIEYYYQDNTGKSIAHNKGVELTKTDLFVCVDSDDYLVATAVEYILEFWDSIDKQGLVGILAFRGHTDGGFITKHLQKRKTRGKLVELYREKVIEGDTMLIYRTDSLKKTCFPSFEGEKFVPEAYLYDQLDEMGELVILPKVLYIGEYLEDGYTKNMARLIVKNPNGYLAWIVQRMEKDILLKHKVGDVIRYISICLVKKEKAFITKSSYPILTLALYPLGYLFYCNRYKKILYGEKDK